MPLEKILDISLRPQFAEWPISQMYTFSSHCGALGDMGQLDLGALLDLWMGTLPDTQNCGLHMRLECRKRSYGVSKPDMHHDTCVTGARAVMYAGIANKRFPLKSVAGEAFPAFPAYVQPAIRRIL